MRQETLNKAHITGHRGPKPKRVVKVVTWGGGSTLLIMIIRFFQRLISRHVKNEGLNAQSVFVQRVFLQNVSDLRVFLALQVYFLVRSAQKLATAGGN